MKNYRGEVKKMLLRCMIRKRDGHFVGTCLELSLCTQGENVSECKRELLRLIKAHIKTVFELHENGENVIMTPVRFYFIKKLLFDCIHFCATRRNSRRIEPPKNSFIKEVVVPAGV